MYTYVQIQVLKKIISMFEFFLCYAEIYFYIRFNYVNIIINKFIHNFINTNLLIIILHIYYLIIC